MKIENNHHNPQPQRFEQSGKGTKETKASTTSTPSATLEISEEAQERGKATTAAGKNAASPAWRAREMMDQYEELRGLRFGQLVSSIARGEDPLETFGVVTPEVPETDVTDTTGEAVGSEAGSADTAAEVRAALIPDVTESDSDDNLVDPPVLTETSPS